MSLNIYTLVTEMCREKGLPNLVADIILNTVCHGYPGEYDAFNRTTDGSKIIRRLWSMCEEFVANTFRGILQNYKYLLTFLLICKKNIAQKFATKVLPWLDSGQMRELYKAYEEVMSITSSEYSVWDGERTDDILQAILDDLNERISAEDKSENRERADPSSCEKKFSRDFFELLGFTVRNILREHDPIFGDRQDEIVTFNVKELYKRGFYEGDVKIRYDIRSLVEYHKEYETRWKTNADPEFKEITILYNRLPEGNPKLAHLNKVLVLSGTRPKFFYRVIPVRGEGETTKEMLTRSEQEFDASMSTLNIFESESHNTAISADISEYLLSELRAKNVVVEGQFADPDETAKRPATHVSFGTLSEAPGSPKSVAKKKDGSDNTFLIIALLLVAVGIVVFFV